MHWLFSNPLAVDHARVTAAILAAERQTSGRIHVLIARHRAPHPVAAAQRHFDRAGAGGAPRARDILIFVAPRSRRFAIVGGRDIHEKCGPAFWTELAAAMGGYFRKGAFTAGLVHGVERAGALLAEHFPATPADPADGGDRVEEAD
jgi:uncharacterized membrane protein